MTSMFKLDLDMVEMYLHTKMKFLAIACQKLYPEQTDRQTDTHTHTHTDLTEIITSPHTRMVNISFILK